MSYRQHTVPGCNTDPTEPTELERRQREAAIHLVYVFGRMSQPVPAELAYGAADIYGGRTDEWVRFLCELFQEMDQEQIDRIVYGVKDKQSQSLAVWYEENLEEHRQRLAVEAEDKKQARIQELKDELAKLEEGNQ